MGICVFFYCLHGSSGCLSQVRPSPSPGAGLASLCSQAFSLQVTLGSWLIRFLAVSLTRVTTMAPLVRFSHVFVHAQPQFPVLPLLMAVPSKSLGANLESLVLRSLLPASPPIPYLQKMVPDPLTGWLKAQVQGTSPTVTRVSGPGRGYVLQGCC